ncbi:hypothetical protein QIJ43_gp1 [ssRNA phage SRR6960551_4]|uniref:Uncharacterized protein n=1 Tax=ssRNA phage SRR6960551_4 TaxID=2786555 RepID=A0A8S5L590_9VIRU|nr:hypothetical protein QIJ43_gp1 [ssRNA phage SRR6960551_4]DAD52604.1 TPA_asm: hypothetical protein [ssRNA phage SRR6960551_4]
MKTLIPSYKDHTFLLSVLLKGTAYDEDSFISRLIALDIEPLSSYAVSELVSDLDGVLSLNYLGLGSTISTYSVIQKLTEFHVSLAVRSLCLLRELLYIVPGIHISIYPSSKFVLGNSHCHDCEMQFVDPGEQQ